MSAMSELYTEIQEMVECCVDETHIVQLLIDRYDMDPTTAKKFVTGVAETFI